MRAGGGGRKGGPMRGLELIMLSEGQWDASRKNCTQWRKETNMPWTWQLYDWTAPEGPNRWKHAHKSCNEPCFWKSYFIAGKSVHVICLPYAHKCAGKMGPGDGKENLWNTKFATFQVKKITLQKCSSLTLMILQLVNSLHNQHCKVLWKF